jgi:hypothetical protein
MVSNPQRDVLQSSETLANSEAQNKDLERLSELSQQTLTKYCDYIMASGIPSFFTFGTAVIVIIGECCGCCPEGPRPDLEPGRRKGDTGAGVSGRAMRAGGESRGSMFRRAMGVGCRAKQDKGRQHKHARHQNPKAALCVPYHWFSTYTGTKP